MISEKQIERTLQKLVRLESTLEQQLFQRVDSVPMKWFHTMERLHAVPEDSLFSQPGESWGQEGQYCWFKGTYTVPAELAGMDQIGRAHV